MSCTFVGFGVSAYRPIRGRADEKSGLGVQLVCKQVPYISLRVIGLWPVLCGVFALFPGDQTGVVLFHTF